MKYDTKLTYNRIIDTLQALVTSRFKFAATCINDVVSGISMYDRVTLSVNFPQFKKTYNLGQQLMLTTLNPQDEDSKLLLNGSLNMYTNFQFKTGSKPKGSNSYNYVFSNLIIDPWHNSDLTMGTASLHTRGDNPEGVWNYQEQ